MTSVRASEQTNCARTRPLSNQQSPVHCLRALATRSRFQILHGRSGVRSRVTGCQRFLKASAKCVQLQA
eukprot:3574770-Amphidinium_carterae.1